ncbi:hypothetical protein AB5J52_25150 [Streptomyces sp. R39]|uniref:Restriction endonuclease subunit S n=1 Tax=Streptomyces sp. R39 TaxID=3238631 RepID=A0AB39QSL6_9ACTN
MTFDLAIEAVAHDVPTGWKVEEFRRHATIVDEVNADSGMPLLSLASTGVVAPRSEEGGMGRQIPSESTIERYWIARPGNLVVNPMWLVGGGIGVSQTTGAVSPDYRVYRLGPELFPPFVHHLLRSRPYRDQYRLYTRAETTFDRRVSKQNFHPMPLLIPPLEEQRRIAEFLDAETAHIDRLAAAQREFSAKLEERDSALLDIAIDELIQSVGTQPFRRFIVGMDQGTSPQCDANPADDDEWGVLKVSCLRPGAFFPAQNKRLPEGVLPNIRGEVRAGDLLITRANTPELVGSTAVVPTVRRKLLLSDKIFRVRADSSLDPRYIALIARGSRVRALCSASSNGASQSMANIRFEEVKEWPIPPASRSVQREVVARVDQTLRQVENLRSRINCQLALLDERRQTLIAAAVTGRLDVTTAQRTSIV